VQQNTMTTTTPTSCNNNRAQAHRQTAESPTPRHSCCYLAQACMSTAAAAGTQPHDGVHNCMHIQGRACPASIFALSPLGNCDTCLSDVEFLHLLLYCLVLIVEPLPRQHKTTHHHHWSTQLNSSSSSRRERPASANVQQQFKRRLQARLQKAGCSSKARVNRAIWLGYTPAGQQVCWAQQSAAPPPPSFQLACVCHYSHAPTPTTNGFFVASKNSRGRMPLPINISRSRTVNLLAGSFSS
jgi:hypothetical protein